MNTTNMTNRAPRNESNRGNEKNSHGAVDVDDDDDVNTNVTGAKNENTKQLRKRERVATTSFTSSVPLAQTTPSSQNESRSSSHRPSSSSSSSSSSVARRRTPWRVKHGIVGRYALGGPSGMGGYIDYKPDFLSKPEADTLLSVVQSAKSWARQPIRLFGKDIMEPRDVILFGTAPYTYSSMTRTPVGWNDDLPSSDRVYKLGCRIEDHLGIERDFFNAVLANKYYHGRDFMGWHADDEVALGAQPLIAAVSVGAERRFVVRQKKNKTIKVGSRKNMANSDGDVEADDMKEMEEEGEEGEEEFDEGWDRMEYVLGHGSLLVMSGNMQEYYQHTVPKAALSKCNEVRVNLSFRRIV